VEKPVNAEIDQQFQQFRRSGFGVIDALFGEICSKKKITETPTKVLIDNLWKSRQRGKLVIAERQAFPRLFDARDTHANPSQIASQDARDPRSLSTITF